MKSSSVRLALATGSVPGRQDWEPRKQNPVTAHPLSGAESLLLLVMGLGFGCCPGRGPGLIGELGHGLGSLCCKEPPQAAGPGLLSLLSLGSSSSVFDLIAQTQPQGAGCWQPGALLSAPL